MTNKEKFLQTLEMLKKIDLERIGAEDLGHVSIGKTKVYVDRNDFENESDVKDWYVHITYAGLITNNEMELTESIDLSKYFDELQAELEPYIKKERSISVDTITINGVEYRKV